MHQRSLHRKYDKRDSYAYDGSLACHYIIPALEMNYLSRTGLLFWRKTCGRATPFETWLSELFGFR